MKFNSCALAKIVFTFLLLVLFLDVKRSVAQTSTVSFDIDIADNKNFVTIDDDCFRYLTHEIDPGDKFQINISNTDGYDVEYFIIVPGFGKTSIDLDDLKDQILQEGQAVHYQIVATVKEDSVSEDGSGDGEGPEGDGDDPEGDGDDPEGDGDDPEGDEDEECTRRTWDIKISTEIEFEKNSNFVFISAIRSIAGVKPTDEIFDLNLKFNYGDSSRAFSFFSLDLSLSETDDDTGPKRMINEGAISVNHYIMSKKKFRNVEGYNRIVFFGAGGKIFDQRVYVGAHVGSLEIGGPFATSYLFVGFYHDIFNRTVKGFDPSVTDREPRNFKNNIYGEVTFSANGISDVPILSEIRLKLGVMIPMSTGKDAIPTLDDFKTRLVLEVPVGRIFRF